MQLVFKLKLITIFFSNFSPQMRSKLVFIFVKELLIDILTVSLPVSGWGHSGDPLRSQGSRVRRLLIIQNWIQEGVEAAAAGGQPVVNGLVSKITFEYLERLCYFESHWTTKTNFFQNIAWSDGADLWQKCFFTWAFRADKKALFGANRFCKKKEWKKFNFSYMHTILNYFYRVFFLTCYIFRYKMSAVKLYGYVETRADEQGYYFYNAPHVYFGFYDYPILNISHRVLWKIHKNVQFAKIGKCYSTIFSTTIVL